MVWWSAVKTSGRSHPFSTHLPSIPRFTKKTLTLINTFLVKLQVTGIKFFLYWHILSYQTSFHLPDSHRCRQQQNFVWHPLFDNKVRTSSLGSFANILLLFFFTGTESSVLAKRYLSSPLELKASGVELPSKKQLPISFSIPSQQWLLSGRKPLLQILSCIQNKPTYIYSMLQRHQKGRVWEATVKPMKPGGEGTQVLKPNHLLSATWISSPDQQQWNYENTPLFQRFDFQYSNTQKAISSDRFKFSNGIGFPLKYSSDVLLNHWGHTQTTRDPFPLYPLAPSGDHRTLTDAQNHQDTKKQASCLE